MKTIPKDKYELINIIKERIKTHGSECDLNDINTSTLTDMSYLFYDSKFNGDISSWNTSKVTNMSHMFIKSEFNGDISNWDVSAVTNMMNMFCQSQFNRDISKWNTAKVNNMSSMFYESAFNGNISNWKVDNVLTMNDMFKNSDIEKPWWAIEDNDKRKEIINKYHLMKNLEQKLNTKEVIFEPKKNKI